MAASSFKFITFCIILLFFSVGATLGSSAAKLYWETKLPNTPMPISIMDSLAAQDNSDDVWLSTHNKAHKWTHSYEVMLDGYEGGGHCHTDAMSDTDILTSTFFLQKHLAPGSKHTVHFRDGPGNANTRFPSPALSHAMPPFKSTHLSTNLRFFNADGPESSDAAMFMNMTLSTCDHPNPINGNNQYCASSLEKLVLYVTTALGGSNDVRALSAPTNGAHRDQLVSYRVVGVRKVATTTEKNKGLGMVACHRLGFPYAVYYCHVPKGTTAYVLSVVDVETKVKTDVNVVCHTQTSEWSSEYVGFKVLGVKPGAHICHFLHFHDLVWYRS